VSKGERDDLIMNFGIPDKLIQVIYNPVDLEAILRMGEETTDIGFDTPTIVAVGRLIHSKGFDVLLEAFRKVRKHMECRLLILGTGVEKEKLLSLSEFLKVREEVLFLDFHHNTFKYLKRANVFCNETRYEGLGNAIIEAMALGLP
jgi:glycosyltransferase involved in cell wall biosynthesis